MLPFRGEKPKINYLLKYATTKKVERPGDRFWNNHILVMLVMIYQNIAILFCNVYEVSVCQGFQ